MKPYWIKTPNFIKFIFKNRIWSFSKKEKIIYLTFDDGPTPIVTEWVLDQLNKYQANATFFCIGKNVSAHPTIFKKILNNNQAIGNHTQNHLNGFLTKSTTYLQNINLAEEQINSQIKNENNVEFTPKIFRPPYGKMTHRQTKKLLKKGYNLIMWDVLSADFDQKISKEKCLENVINNTKNGSIVVFHDSKKAFTNLKYTLPRVLNHFQKKGFRFEKIKCTVELN